MLGIVFHFEVCKVKHKFENLNILKYSFSHPTVNGPWINDVKETKCGMKQKRGVGGRVEEWSRRVTEEDSPSGTGSVLTAAKEGAT